jgi:hypothetical protein
LALIYFSFTLSEINEYYDHEETAKSLRKHRSLHIDNDEICNRNSISLENLKKKDAPSRSQIYSDDNCNYFYDCANRIESNFKGSHRNISKENQNEYCPYEKFIAANENQGRFLNPNFNSHNLSTKATQNNLKSKQLSHQNVPSCTNPSIKHIPFKDLNSKRSSTNRNDLRHYAQRSSGR